MDKNQFATALKDRLARGDTVVTRLGTFYVHTDPGYLGRNPKTGEMIKVGARRYANLLPSDELLNGALVEPRLTHADYRAASEWSEESDRENPFGDEHSDLNAGWPVPQQTCELEIGSLFDDLSAGLARSRQAKISGLFELGAETLDEGPWAGKHCLVFRPSQVLKSVLNPLEGD